MGATSGRGWDLIGLTYLLLLCDECTMSVFTVFNGISYVSIFYKSIFIELRYKARESVSTPNK